MPLTREQDRERMRRRRESMTPRELELERGKARDRMARLRRDNPDREKGRKRTYKPKPGALSCSERGRLGAQARWANHTPVVRERNPVPTEVRAAYSRAHPNSALRKKYPTWEALRSAWA